MARRTAASDGQVFRVVVRQQVSPQIRDNPDSNYYGKTHYPDRYYGPYNTRTIARGQVTSHAKNSYGEYLLDREVWVETTEPVWTRID